MKAGGLGVCVACHQQAQEVTAVIGSHICQLREREIGEKKLQYLPINSIASLNQELISALWLSSTGMLL